MTMMSIMPMMMMNMNTMMMMLNQHCWCWWHLNHRSGDGPLTEGPLDLCWRLAASSLTIPIIINFFIIIPIFTIIIIINIWIIIIISSLSQRCKKRLAVLIVGLSTCKIYLVWANSAESVLYYCTAVLIFGQHRHNISTASAASTGDVSISSIAM